MGAATNKQRSSRTLLGTTWLHEVESYVIVVAFTSPPLLEVDSPLFFSTNRPATRLNPTSSGRFTLAFFIALICTKGSARPFGCTALKSRVSLYQPLCYLRSAKITPILAANSWSVRSTVQSFGAQALAAVSIHPHSFGAQSLRYRLDTPAQLWRASLSYRPTVRTALARKVLAIVSICLHSFGAKQP